jgi:hypothetical protein
MAHNAARHSTLCPHLGAPKSFQNFKFPNQYFIWSSRQLTGLLLSGVCAHIFLGPKGQSDREGTVLPEASHLWLARTTVALRSHVVPTSSFQIST